MLERNNDLAGEYPAQHMTDSQTNDSRPKEEKKFSYSKAILQVVLMFVILGASLAFARFLIVSKAPVKPRPSFKTSYVVDTEIVKKGSFQPIITVYGEVVSARKVELRSLVAGEVTAINPNLKVGEILEKGAPLVEIDRFNYEGALREAEATLAESVARVGESEARVSVEKSKIERAKEQLVLAQNDLDRIEKLRKRASATQKQLDERKLVVSQRSLVKEQAEISLIAETAKLAQQKAVLERNSWRADQAKRDLENTILKAPFTGIVLSTSVEVGKLASANDMLVSMFETDLLDVRFNLSDDRFDRIRNSGDGLIGRPVKILWKLGAKELQYEGNITRLGAEISATRGGVSVYARISTADKAIRPGAFVQVEVPGQRFEQHFRLPDSALYENNIVYVVKQGQLERREVVISGHDGEFIIVGSGLEDGDEVLTTRIAEISSGLKVQTEEQAQKSSKKKSSDAEEQQ